MTAAIKVFYARQNEREAMKDAVEMAVLSTVHHQNIVSLYACFTEMVEIGGARARLRCLGWSGVVVLGGSCVVGGGVLAGFIEADSPVVRYVSSCKHVCKLKTHTHHTTLNYPLIR